MQLIELKGVVLDATTHQPVAGASIQVVKAGGAFANDEGKTGQSANRACSNKCSVERRHLLDTDYIGGFK